LCGIDRQVYVIELSKQILNMKKSILLFIVAVALRHIAAAQNNSIDSLQAVLKTAAEDTSKVNSLNLLSYELLYSNTDTTILLANQAKDLAEKLNYSRGAASAYLRLGQAYNNLGSYDQSQLNLSKALAFSTDKLTTAKIYVNIGINHYEMSNYPEALKYHFDALKIEQEIGDQKGIALSHNSIGLVFMRQGKLDEALKYFFYYLNLFQF